MPTRYINTPFRKYPTKTSKQVRIVIPQPKDVPLYISGSTIRKKQMSASPEWFILHRRGIYRPYVGTDSLEDRAIPKYILRGTLPERIVYRYLVEFLHLQPDSAYGFDFQSSLDGGRLELGGIVADFLFESLKLVLQVQGSTHFDFLRGQKDEEQTNILAAMGYYVENIWEDEIYDLYIFEDRMREIFGLTSHGGGGSYGYIADQTKSNEADLTSQNYTEIEKELNNIQAILNTICLK